MGPSFVRSTRFLRSDAASGAPALRVGLALLAGAWGLWLALGSLTLHAASAQARVELEREAHPLDAPVDGVVARTALQLGRAVEVGELLVELEGAAERLALASERASAEGITARLARVTAELRGAEALARDETTATVARLAEARARADAAETAAHLAETERERRRALFDAAALSALEWERAQAEAERLRAEARAEVLAVRRVEEEGRARARQLAMQEARLGADAAELDGRLRTSRARAAEFEHAAGLRRVTAPVGGVLAEVASLKPGQYVRQGDRLAALVPGGRVRVVAEFDPREALGRVRPGATARLRLEAFPWGQFGALAARVERVGGEVRDGRVRVELALMGAPPPGVLLQHGLPGVVEVDVESLSPLALLARIAGRAAAGGGGPR